MQWLVVVSLLASDVRVPAEDRQANTEWLQRLGVKSPKDGLVLEQPWKQPWTRQSFVVPVQWFQRKAPETINAEQLRQDLPILKQLMANTYGGWATAERRGWNWDRFFTEADAALAGKGDLSAKDAFAFWTQLMDFQLDNHSGPIPGYGASASSRTALLNAVPTGTCTQARTTEGKLIPLNAKDPAQQPHAAYTPDLKPLHYITYPARYELAAIECGGQWIDTAISWRATAQDRMADIQELAQAPAGTPSFRKINADIAYLRLPTFSKQNNELLAKLEPTIKASGEKLLIVDLRRNGGGDARLEAVEKFVKVPRVNGASRLSRSCLYTALRWGYAASSSARLEPPISSGLRRSLQGSADDLLKKSPEGCPSDFKETPGTWKYSDHTAWNPAPGKTRILALIDNGCGSDCEYAVHLLSAIPGTVFAGQNTYGVVQFIQPGYFVLPNTKHPFRIALGTSDPYGDGRSFDGYGFHVDIFLPTRESQQAPAILDLANRLLTGARPAN